ncbi:MAG: acyloxyacyl hydrolase [Burkholderiales bacterium]|nr:acyloxyacyl hydrolase [Burkholderiales bacterium]
MNELKYAIALAAVLAFPPVVFAVDGMSIEYGNSNSSNADVKLYRVGLQWDWKKKWLDTGNWHLGGYWDVSLGYWDNRSVSKTHGSIADIGLTPVFRFQQSHYAGFSPYLEAGIGLHLLSATSVSPERRFGSSFQFGDHLGLGMRFGDRGRYDIGYRYQHLSNAGLKSPNQGINFHQLRLQYNF